MNTKSNQYIGGRDKRREVRAENMAPDCTRHRKAWKSLMFRSEQKEAAKEEELE